MSSRRRIDLHKHHERSHSENLVQSQHLVDMNNAHTQDGVGGGSKLGVMTDSIASSNNTISSQSVLTASRLNNIQNAITQDGVGGGNKLGVMTDAINTNIISSLSKLDTIATNTANIHIDVESVNLNVDTLEAKTEAISNGQTQNGDGTGNKLGVMIDAINTNTITGNSKLDTIITNTASSSSTGLATESTLTALANSLTGDGAGGDNKAGVMLKAINDNIINTNTVALSGVDGTLQGIDTLLGDTQTIHTATNTKLDTLITSNAAIKTAVEILDNVVSGSEAQVDVVTLPALPTGSNTIGTVNLSATDNAVLDAIATDGDNIQTKLDTLITSNASIKTAVEILDNVVSGSEAQVDVVTLPALPTGSNTIGTVNLSATDNAVLDAIATDGDNIQTKLDTLITSNAAIKTAVEILDNVVSGSEAQVDVVSLPSLPAGSNAIGKLSANSGVDIGDVDVTSISAGSNRIGMVGLKANEAADGSGTERHVLCDSAGHLQIDVLSAPSTAVTNAGTFAVQVNGDALTSLQLIDDVVKAEDAGHSSGDKGVHILSVRKNTAVALGGSDADYQPLITDANGKLYTIPSKKFSAITTLFSGVSVGSSATSSASSAVEVPYETGIPSQGLGGGHRITFSSQSSTNSSYSIALTESMDDSTYFTTDTNLNDVGGGAQQNFMGSFQTSARYFKLTITNTHSGSQDFTVKVIGGELS